jgi:hypothetical protein
MPASEANRFNILPGPFLYDGVTALLGDEAADFMRRYKFDISPATDDRPYFFHFFKWEVLPEIMGLRKRGGAGLIEWGYLILVATILQAVLFGALLILVPLSRVRRRWASGTGARMGTYFFLLGLAFLFVEMAFIQRFVLFLSHPLYSVAVVLSGFLVFAGLGSVFSEPFGRKLGDKGYSVVSVAVTGISAVALLYLAVLPTIFEHLIGFADIVKMAVTITLIAPLAFFMGMPFPAALSRLGEAAPDFIPWAWGINGFASVISAATATLLAIEFGFTFVIFAAISLYALAAAIFHISYRGTDRVSSP